MKKVFLALLVCLVFVGCKKHKPVVEEPKLNVEQLTNLDKQNMFINHGGDYRWFETCIKMNNFLDEENDGSVEEIVNIFQIVINRSEHSFDTKVFKFQHFADGTNVVDSVDGFWVEDEPMNQEAIKITFEEAYEKLMAANCPKPHSQYVTLRKQVGIVDANPQYIFGNLYEDIFVDAVTGEVSETNPAFPERFKMPLGEWP